MSWDPPPLADNIHVIFSNSCLYWVSSSYNSMLTQIIERQNRMYTFSGLLPGPRLLEGGRVASRGGGRLCLYNHM
jgi:hypothetical protein